MCMAAAGAADRAPTITPSAPGGPGHARRVGGRWRAVGRNGCVAHDHVFAIPAPAPDRPLRTADGHPTGRGPGHRENGARVVGVEDHDVIANLPFADALIRGPAGGASPLP